MPYYDNDTYYVRVDDAVEVVEFLKKMGLDFKTEQHNNGPIHFSLTKDNKVFEIFPIKEKK